MKNPPTDSIIVRASKTIPLISGASCVLAGFLFLLLPGTWIWAGSGCLIFVGLRFLLVPFRNMPELEIAEQWIAIRGVRFEWSNIEFSRVFRSSHDGGPGRYLVIRFKEPPELTFGTKLGKHFASLGFPKTCDKGISLGEEPRLIWPLNETKMTDDEINGHLGLAWRPAR